LAEEVPADLSGRRVLDVGSGAGYDAFIFKLRGADHVLACEPSKSHEQALFLESIYGAGIDFRNIGWRGLSTTVDGRFELVHCNGVHRALHAMRLLERLREMLAPGGTVLLGSALLADPELSEYARFVPTSFHGDRTWWWVPGRLTFRWWLEAAGFAVEREFGRLPGPAGGFRVETGYLRAGAAEALREEVPTGE
jgi:SAM-dependent methyltransferase